MFFSPDNRVRYMHTDKYILSNAFFLFCFQGLFPDVISSRDFVAQFNHSYDHDSRHHNKRGKNAYNIFCWELCWPNVVIK